MNRVVHLALIALIGVPASGCCCFRQRPACAPACPAPCAPACAPACPAPCAPSVYGPAPAYAPGGTYAPAVPMGMQPTNNRATFVGNRTPTPPSRGPVTTVMDRLRSWTNPSPTTTPVRAEQTVPARPVAINL